MDEGFPEATSTVIVYGPDGKMYSDPLTARRAGVTNYTMQPPAGVPITPISPRDSSVPFNPLSNDQRLNFNQFADAYNAYQNPNLAPVAPAFGGYGYQAPTMDMMLAPQQMPQMMLDPTAIYDPTVGAAMQVLNRPMMIRQTPGLLGDGTDYQRQFGLLRDIAPTRMQQYERIAAPPPPPPSLIRDVGGGGGDYGNYDPYPYDNRGSNPDFARINPDGSYDYTGVNAPFGPGHRDYGDFNYDSFPSERGPAADTYTDAGGGYFDYGAETGYDF